MTWESVPWAVGGGAAHSPETSRLLAHIAAQGNEGVIGLNDLKVSALASPGAGVDVAPGAAAIPCRTPGYTYQMYAGRNPTIDPNIGVTATGAGAGRTDMVIVRVEDPWLPLEPWSDPVDIAAGPYIFSRVLSGVPSSAIVDNEAAKAYLATQNMSAVPLAGITLPVSTSAVLAGHINDLRNVANPRTKRGLFTYNPGAASQLTSATYVDWPASASLAVAVPFWATKIVMVLTINGARIDRSSSSVAGTAVGRVRTVLGTAAPGPVIGGGVAYDVLAPFADATARHTIGAGDTVDIPAGYRGTVQTLKVQGIKSSGNKNIYTDGTSSVTIQYEFQETPA